ncbi:MAG: hypothetical protein M3430_08895 [Acidobacteriota bacterium]|nr:hypothetical protein [Acidobacteriota bacterium]
MYQLAKNHDYGINTCHACFAKQREIDRLTEENQRLRAKLSHQKRKDQEGFFGSSTPSAQIPIKANSTQDGSVAKIILLTTCGASYKCWTQHLAHAETFCNTTNSSSKSAAIQR